MTRRTPSPACSAPAAPGAKSAISSFAEMSQGGAVVWRPEHGTAYKPRKPLDSFPVRDRVVLVESSVRSLAAVDFVGSKRDAGPDAKQAELLATRRPIVSTTHRPRETLMACCHG